MKRIFVIALSLLLLFGVWIPSAIAMRAAGDINFRTQTYARMPPFAGRGGFILDDPKILTHMGYNPSRYWLLGTHVRSVVLVGDLAYFGVDQWTVAGIASAQKLDLSRMSLGSFPAMNAQSIASVTQAIPSLASLPLKSVPLFLAMYNSFSTGTFADVGLPGFGSNYTIHPNLSTAQSQIVSRLIKSVPAVADVPLIVVLQGDWDGALLPANRQQLIRLVTDWPSLANLPMRAISDLSNSAPFSMNASMVANPTSLPVRDFVRQFPAIANAAFGTRLDLKKFSFTVIPNLVYTALTAFPGMKQQPLTAIPKLDEVPIGDIIGWAQLLQMNFAKVDIPWGSRKEGIARYTLSGSTKGDVMLAVPCVGVCPHIELDNSKILPNIDIKGRQWVTGDQLVPGGKGVLGKLNNGLEPTRHLDNTIKHRISYSKIRFTFQLTCFLNT